MNKLLFVLYLFLVFSSSFHAAATCCPANISDLETALQCLCCTLYDYVSIVAFLMINLSSVIFALGNMFGAETRARANVWATSMLTGAIIGLVLIIIVPSFIAIVLGYSSFDASECKFGP